MENVILPIVTSFLATIIAVPVSLIFIRKWKLIDDPATHKHPAIIHAKPVPRGGGIPLFIGVFVSALLFLPLVKVTLGLMLASFIALAVGIADDKLDITPGIRFVLNIVVALIVVGSGVGIPFVTNPFAAGVIHLDTIRLEFNFFGSHSILLFSDILALIWIMWVMNMINWSTGVDGQMPGFVAISAIVIGILSLRFQSSDINSIIASRLSFAIAGSALGFLIFNFYPAKIFPGYGATSIYLLLASVAILSGAKLATAILVLGVPMIDGVFTLMRRSLTGHSPFVHDNKHLHHILLRMGVKQPYIALFYWTISAILGAISLSLSSKEKFFAIVTLFIVILGALTFLHLFIDLIDEERNPKTSL
ncbi:undecaprenyl/decaprenyl-phosphate alpha-N-acetylglucosaminyl 1-phosphate transferase [Patescibacteria group bacterium]|nr:undecaprenyl/decaprenyl-phosphate alpha-N-acetylglucosaminyl 1-phosphate transferase [Patescibacteria group bacterium]MCL5010056.1 undecaprenyl/decaprenyl-phosphate alpha-N-acetylglucosaminyl 1-phosphate transferase [Patescibacteria group bacterium]